MRLGPLAFVLSAPHAGLPVCDGWRCGLTRRARAGGAATAFAKALAFLRLARLSASRTQRCCASKPQAPATAVRLSQKFPRACTLRDCLFCGLSPHRRAAVSIAGPDGLCLANQKYCCLSQAMQCIPTAPFIEVGTQFSCSMHGFMHAPSTPDPHAGIICSHCLTHPRVHAAQS
jgi:hypothetical protein